MYDVDKIVEKINKGINEVQKYKDDRDAIVNSVQDINRGFHEGRLDEKLYKKRLQDLLGKRNESEITEEYNKKIKVSLKRVDEEIGALGKEFEIKIGKRQVSEGLEVKRKEVSRFVKDYGKKKIAVKKVKYSTYKTNFYGVIASRLFINFSERLDKRYPEYFRDLHHYLRLSGIRVFSGTYISMGVLSSIIIFFLSFIALIFITEIGVISLIRSLFIAIILGVIAAVVFYYYPRMVANSRGKQIKDDLPFAIVHMAAVAGSGSQLITIFESLLEAGEYRGLNVEVRRILNYVNLFGYNLNTALKTVAATTPNAELRELLNGIISTSESGGSVKDYLHSKSEDIMVNYRLERKKYVEALSTYSDIYTSILIAAPLLFILLLVIINIIGGDLGGFSVDFLGKAAAFGVVPVLNIIFIAFLNFIKPGV